MTTSVSGGRGVVVVLAKAPVAGRVKTRLTPVFSAAEAAALAGAAIRDTVDTAVATAPGRVVLAWDGPAPPWLPAGVRLLAQRGAGLDERLEHVFEDVFAPGGDAVPGEPVLLVGMDTPQLRPHDLTTDWGAHDAVVGASDDGGYWCIGFRAYVPGSVLGVPMSTAHTGARQLDRLRRLGLEVLELPTFRDVDTPRDAAHVAAVAPWSRFGRLHRRLVQSPCSPATLFDAALSDEVVHVRVDDGEASPVEELLDPSPWRRLSWADEVLLSRCEGPVLDIGCGPGRFVEALAARGVPALGVDLSRGAVARTVERGGAALVRDVHDRLPGEGRWGTVLLADGNIGIGGDPAALLRRCRELVHPGAVVIVETCADPGTDRRARLTLHHASGRRSLPVPWAVVGSTAAARCGREAGFVAVEEWRVEDRAFLLLRQAG